MRKPELSGILLQASARIRKALGVPKHQAPDNDFYVCPFGNEEDTHRVDLDEESGHWYCMDCHAGYAESEKHYSRLDELWRDYHLENINYEGGKPRPVRKNQKITDGELEEYFGSLEGKYVKVETLKKMFGPSPDNPDGLIKINDTDRSTTVISSSFMRRLGKITGKRWTQEKAIGEKGENLVRFVRTERTYSPKKKPSLKEKYSNLITEEKIYTKISEELDEIITYFSLDFIENGYYTLDKNGEDVLEETDILKIFFTKKRFKNIFTEKKHIRAIRERLKYIETLEELLGSQKHDKASDKVKKVIVFLEQRIESQKEE
tara:strand:- start:2275 stop:3231 length:957 start_codon:yes stop_codon:yes gene_type:complete